MVGVKLERHYAVEGIADGVAVMVIIPREDLVNATEEYLVGALYQGMKTRGAMLLNLRDALKEVAGEPTTVTAEELKAIPGEKIH